jgi:hypothetical protein
MRQFSAKSADAAVVNNNVRPSERLREAAIPALADQTSAHMNGISLNTRAA